MPRRNVFAIALVGGVSLLCWQNSQGARTKDDMMELYGTFVDAVELVESNYVRKIPRKELLENALRGMLQNLDAHSSYFSEDEWKQFKKQIDGNFTGIGVQVDRDGSSGRLRVLAPLVGSPAFAAGIMAGDQVLEVNGQSTDGWTRDKAVEAMTGKPGTTLKLKILHAGAANPEEITVKRAVIEIPSVLGDHRKPDDAWDFMLDPEKKIGYVRISGFISNTADELKKALVELKSQGMKGLVLDLRDDPGGLLSAAVEVADLFVESGKIVSTQGRNTREKTFDAEKEGTFTGFPMAVLINQHSASASEIVAACLQDLDRAVIVGQRSFGKGSVQNILPLGEGGESVLKLTVAAYMRPSGKNIHRFKNAKDTDEWGVSPSAGLEVKFTPEEYRAWAEARYQRDMFSSHNKPKEGDPNALKAIPDKQLDKALEIVKAKIAG